MANKSKRMSYKVRVCSSLKAQKNVKGIEKTQGALESSVEKVRHAQTKVHLEMGQKVLLYTTTGHDITDIYGKSLGPKQIVVGSGYVSEGEGRLFVNTENLGRVIITKMKKAIKPSQGKMGDAIYVKCIEE